MKLNKELKGKIDNYFDKISGNEFLEKAEKYNLIDNTSENINPYSMKTLNELLKGKAVNCKTEYEAKRCINTCFFFGHIWSSCIPKEITYWERYKGDTCYAVNGKSGLTYADISFMKKMNMEIISYDTFKEIVFKELL